MTDLKSEPSVDIKKEVIGLILSGRPEEGLAVLSRFYGVATPRLAIGTLKRHRKVAALYDGSCGVIYLSSNEFLNDPFMILHEFYHHLRSRSGKHRGTEKYADGYALSFIQSIN